METINVKVMSASVLTPVAISLLMKSTISMWELLYFKPNVRKRKWPYVA
jgi:hypothetical protein